MGLINTSLVLGKISQVLNEVYELKVEEQARSTELIKQIAALNAKVERLGASMSEVSAKIAGLNGRVDGLNEHAGTLEGFCKKSATKPMIELLGKKMGEIGKTVNDHFESFVKVAERDTELFTLLIEGITGKKVEELKEEASAEPKLARKTKTKTKTIARAKPEASLAEKTVSGTDGNGGGTDGKDGEGKKSFDIVTGQRVAVNTKAGFIHISKKHLDVLYEWGFTHVVKIQRDGKCLVRVVFGKKGSKKVCSDGRIYCAALARGLDEMEGDIVLSNLYINKDSSEMLVMKFPKLNQKRNDSL